MNLIKSLVSSIKLQNLNNASLKLSSIFVDTKRFESTDATDKKESSNIVYETEELPPLPPYKLWQGDENTRAKEYIRNLGSQFKYGVGPRLRHKFIPGLPVIRIKRANKCANRRFYRIVLINTHLENTDAHKEDLGSYDPMPNINNQVVVGINFERIRELMGDRVPIKKVAAQLLGLSGFLPVHPTSYLRAYRNRRALENEQNGQNSEEKKEATA